jgi:hypothetical protein
LTSEFAEVLRWLRSVDGFAQQVPLAQEIPALPAKS